MSKKKKSKSGKNSQPGINLQPQKNHKPKNTSKSRESLNSNFGRVGYSDKAFDPELVAAANSIWRKGLYESLLRIFLFIIKWIAIIVGVSFLIVFISYLFLNRPAFDPKAPFALVELFFDGLADNDFSLRSIFADRRFARLLFYLVILFLRLVKELIKYLYHWKCVESFDGRIIEKKEAPPGKDGKFKFYLTIWSNKRQRSVFMVPKKIYDYFQVQDRVRCHPLFPQHFEKYDKSHDTEVFCMICAEANPIRKERCWKCNNLLVR